MTSKAQRRANRRRVAAVSLPGKIAEQPQRQPDGRIKPEDARKTALQARCRVWGIPDTPEGLKAASDEMLGCAVGRMIRTEPDGKRPALWSAAQHARQTQLAYDRAIGSPNRHAQVARILSPVTAFEASASSPAPDYRTDDERYRQAKSAQLQVEGWIGHTDAQAISAFKQAVINDPDGRIRDWDGVRACLQCIAEGLKGETVKARVR